MRGAWASIAVIGVGASALGVTLGGAGPTWRHQVDRTSTGDAPEFTEIEIRRILQHEWRAIPPDPTNRFADDPRAAHFGQYLFFDTRFSANGQVSCATCHDPAKGFADGLPLGKGLEELTRHSMTLWNVGRNRWFFWDGRIDTLWAQALQPFENAMEMGTNRVRVVRQIASDPVLREAYEALFGPLPGGEVISQFPPDARPVPDDPDHPHHKAWESMREENREVVNHAFVNLGKAIAAYERRIVSRNAPFDRFVEGLRTGDAVLRQSLTLQQQQGLRLFIGQANCRLCHFGPDFTDHEFHNNGVPPLRKGLPQDAGRFDGIGRLRSDPFRAESSYSDDPTGPVAQRAGFLARTPESWGQFRTPTLRNIGQTGPYMHQGQFETLEDVVEFYSTLQGQVRIGHHQETILTALNLSAEEKAALVAFLKSLTGEPLPERLLRRPDDPRWLGD